MPDTCGRTLMKRREFEIAKMKIEKQEPYTILIFLLGVYDQKQNGCAMI